MKTEYKKPNPAALEEVTKIVSDLHTNVPSDEFIKSIEDSEMNESVQPIPKVARPFNESNTSI